MTSPTVRVQIFELFECLVKNIVHKLQFVNPQYEPFYDNVHPQKSFIYQLMRKKVDEIISKNVDKI